MTWEIIISLLGGLGGLELIKLFVNRKTNNRIAEAQADLTEFETLQKTMLFLQAQLKEKEERFAEQTTIVRKLNTEVLDLVKQVAERDIELANVRCDDRHCPFRQPPNAHTPPKDGLTKEDYHSQKLLTQ